MNAQANPQPDEAERRRCEDMLERFGASYDKALRIAGIEEAG